MMLLASLLLFLPQYVPAGSRAPIGGCTSGSFSTTFSGAANTPLSTFNGSFVNLDSTNFVVANWLLSGSNSIQLAHPFDTAGFVLTCSHSDTFQMTMAAAPSGLNTMSKFVCVDAVSGTHKGYCISPCYNDGGTGWGRICAYKDGTEIFQSALGSWNPTLAHTEKISRTGTSTASLTLTFDGTVVGTPSDASSPLPVAGNAAAYMSGDGTIADSQFSAAQDF